MGTALWIPHYSFLYGNVLNKEIDFVTEHLSKCDDGGYFLNDKNLTHIENELCSDEKEEFGDLLNALKEGLKKEDGFLSIEIF